MTPNKWLIVLSFYSIPKHWVYINHDNNCPSRPGCNDFTSLTEHYVLSNLGSEVQSQKTNGNRCLCNTLKSTFLQRPHSKEALTRHRELPSKYSSLYFKKFFNFSETFFTLLKLFAHSPFCFCLFFLILFLFFFCQRNVLLF